MSKKSGKKAPKAPDPKMLLEEEAKANRVNTYSPYGSTTFSQNADGTWNQNITPNEMVQALIDRQMEMAGAAPSTFSSGGAPQGVQDRLAEKLGGMSQPQSNAPQWDAVDMPTGEEMRAAEAADKVSNAGPMYGRRGIGFEPGSLKSKQRNLSQPSGKVMLR